ncbi:MAG: thioredoxin, partial [Clostridia bacterium]|nr:thioredoxin [Clostridia bacterium]
MIKEILNNDMDAALKEGVAVVDFNATWCGPCRMLGPVLEELSEEMAGKVAFYGCDVDENSELAGQYGV